MRSIRFGEVPSLSGEATPEIIASFGKRSADSPLADKAQPIAAGPQKARERLGELLRGEWRAKITNAMASGILSGEKACPTGGADAGGAEGLGKKSPSGGQAIEVRCLPAMNVGIISAATEISI